MKFSIGMRTIDRRGSTFLSRTVDNLKRSGVFDSELFASMNLVDSGSKDPSAHMGCVTGLPIICHSNGKLTPNEAANKAHTEADKHGSDWVIFMEDDLDFCGKFLESTAAWLTKHASNRYPLYLLGSHGLPTTKVGSRAVDIRRFYGTQCYTVNRSASSELTSWLNAHPLHGKVGRGHDMRLHTWMKDIKKTHLLATVPSFVQHIGNVSSMGCRFFTFKSWPGRDWVYK